MNIDINILFSVVGAIILGLIGLVWFLIQLKIGDIDKKRNIEACNRIHIGIDGSIIEIKKDIRILLQRDFASSNSPRELNDEGERIFKQSRIQKIIDEKLDYLISEIEKLNPQTAYDAEKFTESVMDDLKNDTSIIESLKNGAYEAGTDIDVVLFIGSIYLRDKYLEKHFELLKNGQTE